MSIVCVVTDILVVAELRSLFFSSVIVFGDQLLFVFVLSFHYFVDCAFHLFKYCCCCKTPFTTHFLRYCFCWDEFLLFRLYCLCV